MDNNKDVHGKVECLLSLGLSQNGRLGQFGHSCFPLVQTRMNYRICD